MVSCSDISFDHNDVTNLPKKIKFDHDAFNS